MEAKTALYLMRQTSKDAKIEDAQAFLEICADRGLTPFQEAYPVFVRGRMAIKEHYSVQHRWSAQSGGYATLTRRAYDEGGDTCAEVCIVSNQAYAGVGKLSAQCGWSHSEFEAELARQAKTGKAKVASSEKSTRQPPTGKTWEWLALKRATEDAEKQLFGKEPSQSRDLYAAIAAGPQRAAIVDAVAALYNHALPAPAPDVDDEFVDEQEQAQTDEPGELEAGGMGDGDKTELSRFLETATASDKRKRATELWRRAKAAGLNFGAYTDDTINEWIVNAEAALAE